MRYYWVHYGYGPGDLIKHVLTIRGRRFLWLSNWPRHIPRQERRSIVNDMRERDANRVECLKKSS